MRKIILAWTLATAMVLTTTTLNAQSTQTRTVPVSGTYDAIVLAGTQNLHFDIGPAGEPLTVIGNANDLDNLEITVRNGTMTIGFKRGYRSTSRTPVEIYAKNPTLKSAKVSGTGTIDITGRLDSDKNDFSVSGTGRINITTIDCNEVTCSVSGTGRIASASVVAGKVSASVSGTGNISLGGISATTVEARSSGTGNVTVSGSAQSGEYRTSGTGHIHAEDLAASRVNATTSGTGSVYCRAADQFDGRASGTGKIHLYGNPERLNFSGSDRKLVKK